MEGGVNDEREIKFRLVVELFSCLEDEGMEGGVNDERIKFRSSKLKIARSSLICRSFGC
jgi:hypothetical protein